MQARNLPQEECSRILEFLDSTLTSPENFRRQVLISLKEIFGYQRGTFFLADNQGNMHAPVTLNIDHDLLEPYNKYYFKQDIFHPHKVGNRFLRKYVLTVTDIMTIPKFVKTEYFNDFLQIQDIYHEIAMFLVENNRPIGVIGLYRSAREKGFSSTEINTLQHISVHLSQTLAGNLQIAESQIHKELFESSRYLPIGLIIFDRSLKIHYTNDAAMEICHDFLSDGSHSASASYFMAQLLGEKREWQPGLKKTMLSPSLKQYSINVLPAVCHQLKGKEFYTACILPADFSLQGYLNKNHDIQKVFSKREKVVLDLLLKGMNNREIAAQLYLSVHTVKTHLQNIYKKMGVKSRTSLCYKINNQ